MRAAVAAKAAGVDAALISKVYPLRSHSSGAHSGINAALSDGDSWQAHAEDTVKAGDYLNDQDAVEVLCKEGINDVIQLEHFGAIFSRDGQGKIDVMSFPGSSKARTCYVGDSAGHIILQVLYEQLLKHRVQTYNEWFVTSLLVDDGTCRGVMAQDLASGAIVPLYAKAVVLAGGGIGRMYQHSTSAFGATGDAVALGIPRRRVADGHGNGPVPSHHLAKQGLGRDRGRPGVTGPAWSIASEKRSCLLSPLQPATWRPAICAAGPSPLRLKLVEASRVVCSWTSSIWTAPLVDDLLSETQLLVKSMTGVNLQKQLVPVRPAMHRPIGGGPG